jgi:hypothetical protein
MPSKTIKFMGNDEKPNSTLPCGSRKVEYKFFIEVIERRYSRVLGMQHLSGVKWASAGSLQGSATLPETAFGTHDNECKPNRPKLKSFRIPDRILRARDSLGFCPLYCYCGLVVAGVGYQFF